MYHLFLSTPICSASCSGLRTFRYANHPAARPPRATTSEVTSGTALNSRLVHFTQHASDELVEPVRDDPAESGKCSGMPTHPKATANTASTTSGSVIVQAVSCACPAASVRGSPRKVSVICRIV